MPDPTQEKFWRIKSLRCYPQVRKMLAAGKPGSIVAMYIQSERREYIDVKPGSLATMLNAHRQEILGQDVPFNRMPHVVTAAREFTDRLEELRRLENLHDIQLTQIENANAEYLMRGEEHPKMPQLVKAYQDTVNLMHKIKMDLNLTGSRDLGTLRIAPERMAEIERKYGDAGTKVFDSPVSRGRILAGINAAIKRVQEQQGEGAVIEIEPDEDERPEPEPEKPKKRAVRKK